MKKTKKKKKKANKKKKKTIEKGYIGSEIVTFDQCLELA